MGKTHKRSKPRKSQKVRRSFKNHAREEAEYENEGSFFGFLDWIRNKNEELGFEDSRPIAIFTSGGFHG